MSFEVIDNLFQVVYMSLFAALAALRFMRDRNKIFIVLGCGYGSIALGTLYYVLHLIIFTYTPHVFYVAETSWTAGWLFIILVITLRHQDRHMGFSALALLCACAVGVYALWQEMMGPAVPYMFCFAMELASAVYHSVYAIQKRWSPRELEYWILIIVVIQLLVFRTSGMVDDFTRFNIYFAVDIIFTLSAGMILLILHKEV